MEGNEKGVVAPLPPCSLFLCAQQPDGRSRHAVGDGSIDVPIKAWTARWESLFTIQDTNLTFRFQARSWLPVGPRSLGRLHPPVGDVPVLGRSGVPTRP